MHGHDVEGMDLGDAESQSATLDGLRHEVAELRASRVRLVLASDAESRALERKLHEGLQQQLVALSVSLQHAATLAERDPRAVQSLLAEVAEQVQNALDEASCLADRIDAPLLEVRGRLAVALRSAAVTAGVPASVEVTAESSLPPEVARTVYLCWRDALDYVEPSTRPTVTVRAENHALTFEIVASAEAKLDRMGDRLEALGGRLTVKSLAGGETRASGWLPLLRQP